MFPNAQRALYRAPALLAAGLITFGMISAAKASAIDDAENAHRAVSYADLNLNHGPDAVQLYQRIERAAHYVCVANVGITPELRPAVQACLKKAVAAAVATVAHPNLTSVHEAHLGRGAAVVANR